MDERTNEIVAYDPWNELSPTDPGAEPGAKGAFRRFTGLKQKNPALKTILAIGGWNEGSEKYSKVLDLIEITYNVSNLKLGFNGIDGSCSFPTTKIHPIGVEIFT